MSSLFTPWEPVSVNPWSSFLAWAVSVIFQPAYWTTWLDVHSNLFRVDAACAAIIVQILFSWPSNHVFVDVSELIIKGAGRSSHASLKGKDLRKSVCHCLSPFNCYKLHSLVTLLGIPFLVLGWNPFCLQSSLRFHGIDSTRCLKYSSTVYKP